jgi:hypothetical protein
MIWQQEAQQQQITAVNIFIVQAYLSFPVLAIVSKI